MIFLMILIDCNYKILLIILIHVGLSCILQSVDFTEVWIGFSLAIFHPLVKGCQAFKEAES